MTVLTIIFLLAVLTVAVVAFSYWVTRGGIIGWLMANEVAKAICWIAGAIFEAIGVSDK